METYTNDKGEEVVIREMESRRLIHAIAKYSRIEAVEQLENKEDTTSELVKALKEEAIRRLTSNIDDNA